MARPSPGSMPGWRASSCSARRFRHFAGTDWPAKSVRFRHRNFRTLRVTPAQAGVQRCESPCAREGSFCSADASRLDSREWWRWCVRSRANRQAPDTEKASPEGWRGLLFACRGDRQGRSIRQRGRGEALLAMPVVRLATAGRRPAGAGTRERKRSSGTAKSIVLGGAGTNAECSTELCNVLRQAGTMHACGTKKKAPPLRVEPKVETSVGTGFEGGGTVARQNGSGLREEEQPDPGPSKATWEEEELRCIDKRTIGLSTVFSNHIPGMAAMHLPQSK